MKKMHSEGYSSVLITPCYDGRTLKDVQMVAKDGLSVISIKQGHRNCKFTIDPKTKLPLISCAHGMKARNSFWNLHKPELRKVRGLECSTTESVTQMLRAHNVDNAGKPTPRRRILRLLESLVTKKPKSPVNPVFLRDETFWPVNKSVLSSLCQETEMKENGMVGTQDLSDQPLHPTKNVNPASKEQLTGEYNVIKEDSLTSKRKNFSIDEESLFLSESNLTTITVNDLGSEVEVIKETYDKVKSFPNEEYYQFASNTESTHETKLSNENNLPCSSFCTKLSLRNMSVPSKKSLDFEQRVDDTKPSADSFNWSTKGSQPLLDEMYKEMKEIEDYISSHISLESGADSKLKNCSVPETSFVQLLPDNTILNDHQTTDYNLGKNINEIQCGAIASPSTVKENGYSKCNNVDDPLLSYCIWDYEEDDLESKSSMISKIMSSQGTESNASSVHSSLIDDIKGGKRKRNCSKDPILSYCSWDDSFNIEKIISTNNSSGAALNSNVSSNNTALVPVGYIEQVWRECFHKFKLETDEDEQNETFGLANGTSFPHYCHPWASTFEDSVLEEAQTIVRTIDMFVNDNLLYLTNTRKSFGYSPCTIEEINEDEDDELQATGRNEVPDAFNKPRESDRHTHCIDKTKTNLGNHENNSNLIREDQTLYLGYDKNRETKLTNKENLSRSPEKLTTRCETDVTMNSSDSDPFFNNCFKSDANAIEVEENCGKAVSGLVHLSKNDIQKSQSNAQKFLFSTSKIQLNLTNPLQK